MKKIKNKKIKYLLLIMIGIVIGSSIGITATNLSASNIKYNDNGTEKTLQTKIEELYVLADSTGSCPEGKVCLDEPIVKLPTTGVKAIIYLDPTTGKVCTNYTEANSLNETKTGCMKWYAYKEDTTTYTMILDHNTTAKVEYNTSNYYSGMGTGIGYIGYDLRELTSTYRWKVTPGLIAGNEIADITFSSGWYSWEDLCFNGNNCSTQIAGSSEFAWLFDYTNNCTSYRCNVSDSSTSGYWTATGTYDDDGYYMVNAVTRSGSITTNWPTSNSYGLRPVITVNKSDILLN